MSNTTAAAQPLGLVAAALQTIADRADRQRANARPRSSPLHGVTGADVALHVAICHGEPREVIDALKARVRASR